MNISRRTLLQFAAGGLVSTAVAGVMGSVAAAQPLSRPPGALVEEEFLARCARCMRCLDACVPAAIRPGHWLDGPSILGTPILDSTKCIRCMECIRTCPTGALSKIPKAEAILGRMVIDQTLCTAWLGTRRCDRCFRSCRMKGLIMQDRRYPVFTENCDGCGICVQRCPVPGAIYLDSSQVPRFEPQPGRIITTLEDRVGPYEVPPPSYPDWFTNRIRMLARNYGLIK